MVNLATGELVYGRCRATNLCRYCQQLYVLETVEMLLLDAAEWAPSVWVVLTAREHLTRDQCRRHLRQLLLAGRRRWPALQWFVQVEFQRRGALHLNLLVKGVDGAEAEQLLEVLSGRWCDRVDAEPVGQWAGSIAQAGGIVRYLAKHLAHGLKTEQAPPIGWRGHRTSQTGGYLVRPAGTMREEARASQKLRRALWRAIRLDGLTGLDAELAAQLGIAEAAEQTWQLRRVPLTWPAAAHQEDDDDVEDDEKDEGAGEPPEDAEEDDQEEEDDADPATWPGAVDGRDPEREFVAVNPHRPHPNAGRPAAVTPAGTWRVTAPQARGCEAQDGG